MAGGATTWQGLAASAANGEIHIDESVFDKVSSAVYDLVGWIRGVQEMARAVPIRPVSPLPDGAGIARAFGVKTAHGLADVLDSHLTVLTDMADTLRAAGTYYNYTEHHSADALSKVIMHVPLPDAVADVLAAPKKSLLRDADTEKVTVDWTNPQSMSFDELFELGAGINPAPVDATSALWTTMASTLRNSFGLFDTAVGAKRDQWRGDGGTQAFAAAQRYTDDVHGLLFAMNDIVGKLDDIGDALRQTAAGMPQSTRFTEHEKLSMTPAYQGSMQALYTGPLKAAIQLPTLPQPTSMVSGNGAPPAAPGPSGPGTDLTDDKNRDGAGLSPAQYDDAMVDGLDDFYADDPEESTDPGGNTPPDGTDNLPSSTPPGSADPSPGPVPAENGSAPGLAQDPALDRPFGDGADNLGPADLAMAPAEPGNPAPDPAGAVNGAAEPLDGGGIAPYLGGPGPAASTGDPWRTRPFPGRLGAIGAGSGGAPPGRAPEPGPRPAVARPVPRAGIAPDDMVRAGSRSGIPGAPGAPGAVAGRRRDGEEEQEHKSPEYLESEEHLADAIGQLPPVYRPVVDR
ncbi:WXG100 family type VII secretion target [Nocardia sp. X0981]